MKPTHHDNLPLGDRQATGPLSEALLVCCLSGLAALTIGLPAQQMTSQPATAKIVPVKTVPVKTVPVKTIQPTNPATTIDSRLKLLGYGLFLVQIGLLPLKVKHRSPDLAEIIETASAQPEEVAIEH
jgi:hypothetical protein